MKKVLLLSLSIIICPLTFAQELSKEDNTARKELVSRIWTPTIKFRSGQDNRGYDTYYENKYTEAIYGGVSEEFNAKKEEIEKYFLANLFPTLHIGKMTNEYNPLGKQKFIFFPEGWAYAGRGYWVGDNSCNLHLKRTQVFSSTVSINSFYDFTTPDGPALMIETKKNGTSSQRWCTAMTGVCFKVTTTQLESVCKDFIKAINLGATINPDYMTLCNELEQAKTLKKHEPIIYIGPRGGIYRMSSGGNKVYLPRR